MYPVLIESVNGHFEASLLGSPSIRATGSTKAEAVEVLKHEMNSRASTVEVIWVESPKSGLTDLTGKFPYDPDTAEIEREMVAELYRERDAEKLREFPE